MAFMNDFVEREFHNMKQFLNLISVSTQIKSVPIVVG